MQKRGHVRNSIRPRKDRSTLCQRSIDRVKKVWIDNVNYDVLYSRSSNKINRLFLFLSLLSSSDGWCRFTQLGLLPRHSLIRGLLSELGSTFGRGLSRRGRHRGLHLRAGSRRLDDGQGQGQESQGGVHRQRPGMAEVLAAEIRIDVSARLDEGHFRLDVADLRGKLCNFLPRSPCMPFAHTLPSPEVHFSVPLMILFKERNHLMHIKTGNFICICQGRLDIKSAEISIRQIQYLGPFGKVWLEEKRDPIFPPFSCNKKFFAPPPLFCTWMMIYRMCNGIVMSVLLFIFISAIIRIAKNSRTNSKETSFFVDFRSISTIERWQIGWAAYVRIRRGNWRGLKMMTGTSVQTVSMLSFC